MKTGRILCHPFHNGLEGVGMGAGPSRLLGDAAFVDELRAADWRIETIEAPQAADPEIVRIAEADRRLARRVRAAAEEGAFPLVLAGNCNSCLGTVAGLDPAPAAVGVVWFDAHPTSGAARRRTRRGHGTRGLSGRLCARPPARRRPRHEDRLEELPSRLVGRLVLERV